MIPPRQDPLREEPARHLSLCIPGASLLLLVSLPPLATPPLGRKISLILVRNEFMHVRCKSAPRRIRSQHDRPCGTGLRGATHLCSALHDAASVACYPSPPERAPPAGSAWAPHCCSRARMACRVSAGLCPWRKPMTSRKDAARSRASSGSRSSGFSTGSASSHSSASGAASSSSK